MATALLVAVALAAEPKPALLGSTREQVVRRMGEPRSQIVAGNRLVMLYARERVVLRDGVVVDVEQMFVEPARRGSPPSPPAPAPPPAAGQAAAGAEQPASATSASAMSAAAATVSAAASPTVPENVQPAAQEPASAARVDPVQPSPPESKLEIKLVRPPAPGSPRPQPRAPTPAPVETVAAAPAAAPATAPALAAQPAAPPPAAPVYVSSAPSRPTEDPAPRSAASAGAQSPATTMGASSFTPGRTGAAAKPDVRADAPARTVEETPAAEEQEKNEEEKARLAATEKRAKVIKASRRRLEATLDSAEPDPVPNVFSTRTYIIAFVTAFGGIGYLVWRFRQHQLLLAATAVSQNPFSPTVATGESGVTQFSADRLAKLEWKRFEELVEAYYSKTGVVAVRTKGGPSSPAQVKISWKGEPRPFAMVRCISHPDALIEVKPLQELYSVLAAEDIRRGYVVTTGRFSVAARDYAEEKHLTLLPSDIFLEKLNALPEAARTEIMQATLAGDYTTPSCPTCEAKMARTTDDPPVWRCASHPDFSLPVRD